jgi:hypothetical protein
MPDLTRPNVHLWIYNHAFYAISDQVDFFVMALTQQGYAVSVGRKPDAAALNVVIENFTADLKKPLVEFCRSTRKRVAVVMTEHLDFDGEQILIHGDPLWSKNDYMPPGVQLERIKHLMDCLPYLRCFLILGDLPELHNMSMMLPGIDVCAIPFPRIPFIPGEGQDLPRIQSDLLFTGVMTGYREDIYNLLRKNGLSVACPQKFVSRRRRDTLTRCARLALNIPQREDWRWLSLMRIIAALRSGRATVSVGTRDTSQIASCCVQLDVTGPRGLATLKEHVANWQELYRTAFEDYTAMADRFEREHAFPHGVFEYWAVTDGLPAAGMKSVGSYLPETDHRSNG